MKKSGLKEELKDAGEVLVGIVYLPVYAFKEARRAWKTGDRLTAIYAVLFVGLIFFVIWQG